MYICDFSNRRIQILTLDLEYSNTIQLGEYPYTVQISNTTIGVSCRETTIFYDLDSKTLKYKHKIAGTFTINYIHSTFCGLSVERKKIYFFDSDGNFLDEKAFHEKLILTDNGPSGSMCRYKDILYESGEVFKFVE